MRDNASGRKVGIRGRVPLVLHRAPERHSGDKLQQGRGVARTLACSLSSVVTLVYFICIQYCTYEKLFQLLMYILPVYN